MSCGHVAGGIVQTGAIAVQCCLRCGVVLGSLTDADVRVAGPFVSMAQLLAQRFVPDGTRVVEAQSPLSAITDRSRRADERLCAGAPMTDPIAPRVYRGPVVARMASSRDTSEIYEIRRSVVGEYSCSCKTFLFRRHCSHAQAIAVQGLSDPIAEQH